MTDREHKIKLWEAIQKYVRACGGDPEKHVYGNTGRMDSVTEIEQLVYEKEENKDE